MRRAAATLVCLLFCSAGVAGADETPTSPEPDPSTTTTTTEPASSSSSTTSTSVPPVSLPDPVDLDAGPDPTTPAPPGPWDTTPAADSRVAAVALAVTAARERVAEAESLVDELTVAQDRLAREWETLTSAEADAARRHAATRARFSRRVAAAYVTGAAAPVEIPSPAEPTSSAADRRVLPGAVADADRELAEQYRSERDQLSDRARVAAQRVAENESRLRSARTALDAARAELTAALTTPPSGVSTIGGFVFPVAGPHQFISSFGFCRDGCSRSHQGNDIFADEGVPVVAVEDGWVERVGTNRLGGLIVWTRGRSGYRYYYAHLAAYGPVVAGQEVRAGDLVGFVGRTGNAATTPPHLHFEIHPGTLPAIDPYPILVNAPVMSPPPAVEPSGG